MVRATSYVIDDEGPLRQGTDVALPNQRSSTSPGAPTSVLLADQPLWRYGLKAVLERIGVEVVGMAESADTLVALVRRVRPDVLVADTSIRLGGTPVLPVLRQAIDAHDALKVVVLNESRSAADRAAAFDAGALAYVVKTSHPDDIASAIRQTFDHSVFFATPPDAHGDPAPRALRETSSGSPLEQRPGGLTPRETEILRLVAEGRSNGAMARALWVTEQTVKFHLSNIYRKLEVANRTEPAAAVAQRPGDG